MSEPIGVISSHFSEENFPVTRAETVKTPWGEADVFHSLVGGLPMVGIWRYGRDLDLPSHRINFAANIWALKLLGVRRVMSQNAIGCINPTLQPGDVVIPHDFIDATKHRQRSLFDEELGWLRVDLTRPFCPTVRQLLIAAGNDGGTRVVDAGVFVCVEGPRFETPAEIRMYARLGGDIIGTPMVPEVIMAREAELCFASIAPIINYASGLAPAVVHVGKDSMVDFYYGPGGLHARVEEILVGAIGAASEAAFHCDCDRALDGALEGPLPSWYSDVRGD